MVRGDGDAGVAALDDLDVRLTSEPPSGNHVFLIMLIVCFGRTLLLGIVRDAKSCSLLHAIAFGRLSSRPSL